eukprot:gene12521-biopygen7758
MPGRAPPQAAGPSGAGYTSARRATAPHTPNAARRWPPAAAAGSHHRPAARPSLGTQLHPTPGMTRRNGPKKAPPRPALRCATLRRFDWSPAQDSQPADSCHRAAVLPVRTSFYGMLNRYMAPDPRRAAEWGTPRNRSRRALPSCTAGVHRRCALHVVFRLTNPERGAGKPRGEPVTTGQAHGHQQPEAAASIAGWAEHDCDAEASGAR